MLISTVTVAAGVREMSEDLASFHNLQSLRCFHAARRHAGQTQHHDHRRDLPAHFQAYRLGLDSITRYRHRGVVRIFKKVIYAAGLVYTSVMSFVQFAGPSQIIAPSHSPVARFILAAAGIRASLIFTLLRASVAKSPTGVPPGGLGLFSLSMAMVAVGWCHSQVRLEVDGRKVRQLATRRVAELPSSGNW